MRTTLDLSDELLTRAKQRAIEENSTLTRVVEEALRLYLSPGRPGKKRVMRKWVVVKGERTPDIDISDRGRLYDLMKPSVGSTRSRRPGRRREIVA